MSLGDTSLGVSSPSASPGISNAGSLSPISGVLHTLNYPAPTLAPPSHPQSYDSEFPVDHGTVLESRSGVNAASQTSLNPHAGPCDALSTSASMKDTTFKSRIDTLKGAILDPVNSAIPYPVTLKLSVPEFQELDRLGNTVLFPEWERLHIDYDEEYLNIKRPTFIHAVFCELFFKQHNETLIRLVKAAGSSNIDLFECKQMKSPTFSFFERLPETEADKDPHRFWTPTAVFEIGLSETINKLNLDAARVLVGSYGLVRIVMNVNIKKGSQMGQSDWVTADLWASRRIKLPHDDYATCEIKLKEVLTYYDVEAGSYKAASKDLQAPTCWKYFYCFETDELGHMHFIAEPIRQFLVHHNEQSSKPPDPLTKFASGPIEIPRFMLIGHLHHMYSRESRFNCDLTIEFAELLEVIRDYMSRDESWARAANVLTEKIQRRIDQRNKDQKDYEKFLLEQKGDGSGAQL